MMFDAQAATFFAYLLESKGPTTVREIVELNRSGQDIEVILEKPEYLGTDFEAVENDWRTWVEKQKVESRGGEFRRLRTERIGD
jgi:hypothetical protein